MSETHYPLVFTYRDLIEGQGFVSRVAINGRALMRIELDDQGQETEAWIFSVNPGGICADGSSSPAAALSFRDRYLLTLLDIAAEAASFDEFEAEIERLFHDTNNRFLTQWNTAHELVRSGSDQVKDLSWIDKEPITDDYFEVQVLEISCSHIEDAANRPRPTHSLPQERAVAA